MPDFTVVLGVLNDIQHLIHIMDCDGVSVEEVMPTKQARASPKLMNAHCPRKSFGHGGSIYSL